MSRLRRTLRMLLLAPSLVAGAAGCRTAEVPAGVFAEWTSEREQRGDTTIVRTLEGSVWGDTMVLVPVVAVGELDGDGAYVFGAPGPVDLAADGRLVVADRQAREIRVFDGRGAHVATFGRHGDGPGEFQDPDDLRVTAAGEVVVRDQRSARFTVFSLTGELVRSWPIRGGFTTSSPMHLTNDGRLVNPTIGERLGSVDVLRTVWEVRGVDGTTLDTIPVPSTGWEAPFLEARGTGVGFTRYVIPFMPRESTSVLADGSVVFALSTRYRFQVTGPDGAVLVVERVVSDPAPVTSGEAAAERERLTRNLRMMDPSWQWSSETLPTTKPPFQAVIAGTDGSVWVRRHTTALEEPNPSWDPERPDQTPRTRWVEPVVFDVFDGEGRYMGPVKFPAGYVANRRGSFSLEHVLAIVTHSLGHEQVVLYEFARPQGS